MTDAPPELAQPESQNAGGAQDKSGSLWIFWLAIALLFAYPLSLGPVAKYYDSRNKPVAPRAVIVFYQPLEILYHKSPTVHKMLDWYLHIWRVR